MRALVTGSAGLVGSSVTELLLKKGWEVIGVDNDARGHYLGASTAQVSKQLLRAYPNYGHRNNDIRDFEAVHDIMADAQPDFIVHAAGQPSHEFSAREPVQDFSINTVGTMNLLSATREYCPASPFAFISTNKVYGTEPNQLPFDELPARYFTKLPWSWTAISCAAYVMRSPFGASKLAADILVQEFGRYYGLQTACFRCGCITGARHQAVETHGFLAYLVKCAVTGAPYTIYGYDGKQVRDQLHADDLASLLLQFYKSPTQGEVFNVGGGQENSISIVEAIEWLMYHFHVLKTTYDPEPRKGDHRCYITDLTKVRKWYPKWKITRSLDSIMEELVCSTSQASASTK